MTMTGASFLHIEEEVESIAPRQLKEQNDSGEDVFVLDIRSEDDFDEWHIDDENVEIVNNPSLQLLDDVPEDLLTALPEERTITVLCAKGGSSELIVGALQAEGYDANHLERGMKGWARLYEYTERDADIDATIAQYQRPSSGCLAYLVVSNDEAAVIDALRAFAENYIQDARTLGVEIKYTLDTHIHADHISGVRTVVEQTNATAIMPAAASRGVGYDRSYEIIEDGDTLMVGDVEINVLHTPGHTTGMTAYKVENVLLTGDELFTESIARPDLEDPETATDAATMLYKSPIKKVLTQPENTIIAPTHFSDAATPNNDDTSTKTLGELDTMDALSMNKDTFVAFVVSNMPSKSVNYEAIIATNLGQKSPDAKEAFELEPGPNNCAASTEALTN